jgi:H+/Cl- antiporter ClcA
MDIPLVSKRTVTRLFIGGLATTILAGVLVLWIVWAAFANGVIAIGGPDVVEVNGSSTAWMLVGLLFVAVLAAIGGSIAAILSWLGALLNTFRLEDRTWFLALLVFGVLGFGVFAMIAYVTVGPDGARDALTPSRVPTTTVG